MNAPSNHGIHIDKKVHVNAGEIKKIIGLKKLYSINVFYCLCL